MPVQSVSSLSTRIVQSEKQALALLHASISDGLRPFQAGPRSPSDLVQVTGQTMMQVLRSLKYWQKLDILEVKQVQKRAGRAIRYYGLTAPAFYIPLTVMPLEEVFHLINQPMQKGAIQALAAHLRYQSGADGVQVFLEAPSGVRLMQQMDIPVDKLQPDFRTSANRWQTLQLDYAEACALNDELCKVIEKYQGREGAGTYILHWLMTPTGQG